MIETILLMNDDTDKAFKESIQKDIAPCEERCVEKKNKERSMYELTDKEENVKPQTIVFEAFGEKNYE